VLAEFHGERQSNVTETDDANAAFAQVEQKVVPR
jgi:hypothetical protein